MTSAPPRAIVNVDGLVAKYRRHSCCAQPPTTQEGQRHGWPLPSERTEAAGLLRPASLSSLLELDGSPDREVRSEVWRLRHHRRASIPAPAIRAFCRLELLSAPRCWRRPVLRRPNILPPLAPANGANPNARDALCVYAYLVESCGAGAWPACPVFFAVSTRVASSPCLTVVSTDTVVSWLMSVVS